MFLRMELFQYGTLVFGKIIEQNESLRSIEVGASAKEFISKNAISIVSQSSPDIGKCGGNLSIYIRGYFREDDDNIMYYNFDTKEEADIFCDNVKELVKELNAQNEAEANSFNVRKVLWLRG